MLLAFVAVAAVAAVGYTAFNSKKSINRILMELYYEYQFQIIGARALADDHIRRSKNVLPELQDRCGQVAIVTGGARGIGVEIVKVLLKNNIKVVMGVRRPEQGLKVVEALKRDNPKAEIDVLKLDVSSLKSVKEFADQVSKVYSDVNILVNNAGIMFGDYSLTDEGFENQLATNYLGHFYLTHLLMPNLKRAGEKTEGCSRIVNVSSCAHFASQIHFDDINMKSEYYTKAAYGQSKVAQIMFARYLNAKLEASGSKVKCYSVHPGIVNTDLFENTPFSQYCGWIMRNFFKTPEQGAISVLYTCLSPKLENRGGLYVSNCRQGISNEYSKDENMQKKLFDLSCEMVKINKFGEVL